MYYITKYAASQGIMEYPDDTVEFVRGYAYVGAPGTTRMQVRSSDCFHNDWAAAVKRAREIMGAKIKGYEKAIQRLKEKKENIHQH